MVLLGHNLDDTLEGFCMRISHLSGIIGLSSTGLHVYNDGLNIIRPLLSFSKGRIVETCKYRGIKWWEDPTNDQEIYARNVVRKGIGTLSYSARNELVKVIRIFDNIKNLVLDEVVEFLEQYVSASNYGFYTFSYENFVRVEDNICEQIILRFVISISRRQISSAQRRSILENIYTKKTYSCGGLLFWVKKHIVYISRDGYNSPVSDYSLNPNIISNIKFLDWELNIRGYSNLSVRLGTESQRDLSMIRKSMPKKEKLNIPINCTPGSLVLTADNRTFLAGSCANSPNIVSYKYNCPIAKYIEQYKVTSVLRNK
eukprot:TRINITY_DN5782_c0_g1_i1.p1 TRINITY_DN5782_c0_g1~~TRINITY_DN5782_c0_g1_i1.p1  ORF type:complete len:314 (-),score=50.12 TRINITY_DN5782_c0_g1_i1:28-969(-)